MTLEQAKSGARRILKGWKLAYWNAPELTATFVLFIGFLFLSSIIFNFWGFWVAFLLSSGAFALAGWYTVEPKDEYGDGGL